MSEPTEAGSARSTAKPTGRLLLIPVPIGPDDNPLEILPSATLTAIRGLRHFVVENAKSARAVLKRIDLLHPLQSLQIDELNQHTSPQVLPDLLAPALNGDDLGLMSEAGCPAVADPGSALVALAHRRGVPVLPLIGPSSLLLALMASGMSGQSFAFVGYLPVAQSERHLRLQALERRARSEGQTQLMIETPYRNAALFDAALAALAPETWFGLACDLSLPGQRIEVRRIAQWREAPTPPPRSPTVFLLSADAAPAPVSAGSGARRRR